MKLDAVYLVAPQPSRRAFLIGGSAFFSGVCVAGVTGFALGRQVSAGSPVASPPASQAELAALRQLAIEAPVDDLAAAWVPFLERRGNAYLDDVVLVDGMHRLARHVLASPDWSERRACAATLARSASFGAAVHHGPLQALVPQLRSVR